MGAALCLWGLLGPRLTEHTAGAREGARHPHVKLVDVRLTRVLGNRLSGKDMIEDGVVVANHL